MHNYETNAGYPVPAELLREKAFQNSRRVSDEFSPLTSLLRQRFGESLDAIILYGSCLHSSDIREGVVDFYVVVNDYKQAFDKRSSRFLGAFLPPTVFYLEDKASGLKAKYAVISMADFRAGIQDWFHPYLWARFAQPARVVYVRDGNREKQIHGLLAHAVLIFLRNTLPVLGGSRVSVEEIWTNGFTLSYAAELRPEPGSRPRQLSHSSFADYVRLTEFAAPALGDKLLALDNDLYQCGFEPGEKRRTLRKWRLRHWQGRLLTVLRLIKATFTFANCIDYAAWKIKRHTGVSVEITPRLRRFPILWGLKVLWSLVRQGVVR